MGRELIIRAARDSGSRKGDPRIADLVLRARGQVLKQESPERLSGDPGFVATGSGQGPGPCGGQDFPGH